MRVITLARRNRPRRCYFFSACVVSLFGRLSFDKLSAVGASVTKVGWRGRKKSNGFSNKAFFTKANLDTSHNLAHTILAVRA